MSSVTLIRILTSACALSATALIAAGCATEGVGTSITPRASGSAVASTSFSDGSLRSVGARYRVQSTLSFGGRTLSTSQVFRVWRTRVVGERWSTRTTFETAGVASAAGPGVREILYTEGAPTAQVAIVDGRVIQVPASAAWTSATSSGARPYTFLSVENVIRGHPASHSVAPEGGPTRLPGGLLSATAADDRIRALEVRYGRPSAMSARNVLQFRRLNRDTVVTLEVSAAIGEVVGARVIVGGVEVLRLERVLTQVRPNLYVVSRSSHSIVDRGRRTAISTTVLIDEVGVDFTQ